MNFHSSSPKNGNSTLREGSLFEYYNSIHVAKNNSKLTFNLWEINETQREALLYCILMDFHSGSPRTNCVTWSKHIFDCMKCSFKYQQNVDRMTSFGKECRNNMSGRACCLQQELTTPHKRAPGLGTGNFPVELLCMHIASSPMST